MSCSIMSAIDMYSDVKIIEGKNGEKRVCLTLNGAPSVVQTMAFDLWEFRPHSIQLFAVHALHEARMPHPQWCVIC